MTTPNLATSRFVLQCLLQELEQFDRDIPVARNIQVGNVADALTVLLADRRLWRLTMQQAPSSGRPVRLPRPSSRRACEDNLRVSRSA
jgi:hypothetical protein